MFNRRMLINEIAGTPLPPLPEQETYLVDGVGVGEVTFTIPKGVDVVKLYYDVYHEHDGDVQIYAESNNGIFWCDEYGYEGIVGSIYVGVTSGATYTLSVMTNSETGTESGYISVSYSKAINSMKPSKTDYVK